MSGAPVPPSPLTAAALAAAVQQPQVRPPPLSPQHCPSPHASSSIRWRTATRCPALYAHFNSARQALCVVTPLPVRADHRQRRHFSCARRGLGCALSAPAATTHACRTGLSLTMPVQALASIASAVEQRLAGGTNCIAARLFARRSPLNSGGLDGEAVTVRSDASPVLVEHVGETSALLDTTKGRACSARARTVRYARCRLARAEQPAAE